MHAEFSVQRPRVGYLGPAGTFTEEALRHSARVEAVEEVAFGTIYDTALAVRRREVEWAVVPIENSLEGSVTVTLDLLADEHGDLEIVGEALIAVRHTLTAAEPLTLSKIDTVITHPHVPGQCTRLLRGELAHARVLPASSTAEAVRLAVSAGEHGTAAIGTRLAAQIYGGVVIREGVQDRNDNVTRFVWLGQTNRPAGQLAPLRSVEERGGRGWKTSVVFWGAGAESPGWLVRCLDEFARRAINLTKIESRPQRARLGHYVFFVDLQGGAHDPAVAEALAGVRAVCEELRILGSYRAAAQP
jgi:prephenate dehydratase